MPGQLKLIRRRKQAIDGFDGHSYLLRSLAAPGQVYIDTGAADLPVQLAPETVDEAKRRAIEDILRVRPIYALQGPPGTGKTTLVAWLLREILQDDPVAQVLVTAQAHGAVDVLRARVTEAFEDVAPERRPLAVRLGSRRDDDDTRRTPSRMSRCRSCATAAAPSPVWQTARPPSKTGSITPRRWPTSLPATRHGVPAPPTSWNWSSGART